MLSLVREAPALSGTAAHKPFGEGTDSYPPNAQGRDQSRPCTPLTTSLWQDF